MKRNLLSLLFLTLSSFTFSQTATYWVTLKDKSNSPYKISDPKAYLSERAIVRRERQHISITEKDIPVNSDYVNKIIKEGAVIKSKSKWFNAVSIILIDETKIEIIKKLPFVTSVKKIEYSNSIKTISKFDIESELPKNVPSNRNSAGTTSFNYGPSFNQAHMIAADCMHDKGFLGEGIVIAQFDAGWANANTLPVFDSLRANNQILGCRDLVTGDTMVYNSSLSAHGMNVLSCMGGNLPGSIIGTSPKAKFWLMRTEDAASESWQEEINWAVAAEFADSVGADIISSSLGYSDGMTNPAQNHTYADMDGNTTIVTKAADWAASVGIFVSSSAGNSGGSPWYKITAPADADSVLTVGAVNANGSITSFSSRGPTYDGRIKPNVVAQGGSAITAGNSGGIAVNSGTSFSCPITSGAVACLWQANPTKTNMEILYAIEQSCSQSISPDSIYGYGIPDFCIANEFLVGIDVHSLKEETLNVFPNPFNTNFEIELYSLKKQIAVMELFDVTGRKIMSKEFDLNINMRNSIKITETDNLTNGIYFLTLKTEDHSYFKKMIKAGN